MSAPISKDTSLYISIAERPSNFGTTLFNAAFGHEGIDAVYKACAVEPGNLRGVIAGIRALGIRGCGVSMPFKKEVLKYLDTIDPRAKKIGAVNTIVNNQGRLTGYNTDYYGALSVLRTIPLVKKFRVVMLGSGGVACAISAALSRLGVKNVTVVTKDKEEGLKLLRQWNFSLRRPWTYRNSLKGDLLINATPIGMAPHDEGLPVETRVIPTYQVVMDVVTTPLQTRLIRYARRQGCVVIPGYTMSLAQAAKQFELYTGTGAPLAVMERTIRKIQ